MLRIACLQTNSGNDFAANLETLTAMTREAVAGGVLPGMERHLRGLRSRSNSR